MKKQIKLLIAVTLLLFAFSSSYAQLSLGGGLGFGTDITSIGITIKGNYPFIEEWEGSGSFTYFIPKNESQYLNISLWEFNVDAHYILNSTEKYTFYPLAGLSLTGVTFDYDNLSSNPFFTTVDRTVTQVGLNIGAGGTLLFSESLSGYAEVKYVIGGFGQLVANVGVLFQLKGGK